MACRSAGSGCRPRFGRDADTDVYRRGTLTTSDLSGLRVAFLTANEGWSRRS